MYFSEWKLLTKRKCCRAFFFFFKVSCVMWSCSVCWFPRKPQENEMWLDAASNWLWESPRGHRGLAGPPRPSQPLGFYSGKHLGSSLGSRGWSKLVGAGGILKTVSLDFKKQFLHVIPTPSWWNSQAAMWGKVTNPLISNQSNRKSPSVCHVTRQVLCTCELVHRISTFTIFLKMVLKYPGEKSMALLFS